jgi:serine/threonine protein kinase
MMNGTLTLDKALKHNRDREDKAVDVNLHCPVTLKVISERYLDDESARLRFLREARAAASVRHPNVASVFHALWRAHSTD